MTVQPITHAFAPLKLESAVFFGHGHESNSSKTLSIKEPHISKDMFLQHLATKPHLMSLHVYALKMDGSWVQHIVEKQPHLRALSLTGQTVSDSELLPIKNLLELQSLSLRFSKNITGTFFEDPAALTSLTHVDLEGCTNFMDNGLVGIAKLENLESLSLVNCWSITNGGLESLKSLKNLKKLDLTCCFAVTEEGIVALKESLPNLEITGP